MTRRFRRMTRRIARPRFGSSSHGCCGHAPADSWRLPGLSEHGSGSMALIDIGRVVGTVQSIDTGQSRRLAASASRSMVDGEVVAEGDDDLLHLRTDEGERGFVARGHGLAAIPSDVRPFAAEREVGGLDLDRARVDFGTTDRQRRRAGWATDRRRGDGDPPATRLRFGLLVAPRHPSTAS